MSEIRETAAVTTAQPHEAAPADELLVVDGLDVQFATGSGRVTVVEDVSFSLDRGETLGIVGESGSGKTVTSLSLLGLIPSPPGRVSRGSITLNGQQLVGLSQRRLNAIRGEEIAMIFQEPMTSLNPAFKVGDQIAESYRRHRRVSRKDAYGRAVEVLDRVGIPNASRRARSYPHEFSGGMRQRAMIAIALACDPKVLVADEPTTALDVTIQAQVLELMGWMRDELDMALIFVTHDLSVVADICDRVVVMYAGQVVEQAAINDLYYRPQHPYTEALLASMPQASGTRTDGKLVSIPGNPPAPGAFPTGCRYHPRCEYAEPECTTGEDGDVIALRPRPAGQLSRCRRVDEIQLRGSR